MVSSCQLFCIRPFRIDYGLWAGTLQRAHEVAVVMNHCVWLSVNMSAIKRVVTNAQKHGCLL